METEIVNHADDTAANTVDNSQEMQEFNFYEHLSNLCHKASKKEKIKENTKCLYCITSGTICCFGWIIIER